MFNFFYLSLQKIITKILNANLLTTKLMKKLMTLCLMATICAINVSAQTIYDINVKDGAGNDISLADYKGKLILIVNTATRCGFTPQYEELQSLYENYHSQGLEILDFPCNQFGEQAPGTFKDIHQFCTANYDIKFPQFDKVDVNGQNEHPIFTYLKSQKGFNGFDLNDQRGKFMDDMLRKQDPDYDKKPDIKWNFTKFLVNQEGKVIKRYEPTQNISEIEADICIELNPIIKNIMERRSVRKYLDKPVEHEKLKIVARCGINAPSGMNSQPWIVRVVEDQKLIADINEVFKKANPDMVKRDKNFKNMFRNAPNIICVCSPLNGGDLDAGLLGENMMLAAKALGLGTCCLGGPVRFINSDPDAKFFLQRLEIPDGYRLNYIIAIGYPDEKPDAKPRDDSKVKFITE